MNKRNFFVRACWDPEAQVFFAESDIEGLHIEAESIDQFESLMMELAPELIMSNHVTISNFVNEPAKNWVPAIFWQRPEVDAASA